MSQVLGYAEGSLPRLDAVRGDFEELMVGPVIERHCPSVLVERMLVELLNPDAMHDALHEPPAGCHKRFA